MDWTKILNKEILNAVYKISVIIIMVVLVLTGIWGRGDNDTTDGGITGQDYISIREQLESIEQSNKLAIESITELIDTNERLTSGFIELSNYNSRIGEVAAELQNRTSEHTSRIRQVQDTTLGIELATDGVEQLLRKIELSNGNLTGSEQGTDSEITEGANQD